MSEIEDPNQSGPSDEESRVDSQKNQTNASKIRTEDNFTFIQNNPDAKQASEPSVVRNQEKRIPQDSQSGEMKSENLENESNEVEEPEEAEEDFVAGYGQLNNADTKLEKSSAKPLPELEKVDIDEISSDPFEEAVQMIKQNKTGAVVDDFDPMDEKYKQNLETLLNVKFDFIVEVGRVNMRISDILLLGQGSVIELDKLVGDELNLMVNDKWIARGEIVIFKERFGTRINHILSAEERLKKLGSTF